MLGSESNKILIVEDDLTYRNMVRDYLSSHNFSVSVADDGAMAMEKILVHRPNLVILDLLLPKVDGFEVLKRIRSYPEDWVKNVKVVVLSNLSDHESVLKTQELTISAYFVKANTSPEQVLNKIVELLYHGQKQSEEVLDFTKD